MKLRDFNNLLKTNNPTDTMTNYQIRRILEKASKGERKVNLGYKLQDDEIEALRKLGFSVGLYKGSTIVSGWEY